MKNNLMKLLSLALCLMFLCPAALAQEVSYKIGEPTNALLADALTSGKMLTAALKLDLELDAAALGLSQEEGEQIAQVLQVLKQATFVGGVGLIDDGLRLALEGELADEASGNSVGVNAALDLTLDGLRVESDLIEGRRVAVQWETLLALAGADESSILMFSEVKNALKSEDLPQMIAQAAEELAAQIGPALESLGQIAAPYGETILNFILTLPIEAAEDLHEEGYPATATEISITVTQKDLGDLLIQLCDQLDQDATLKLLIDQVLAQSGEDVTLAQLISEVRAEAAEMTDTSMPLIFFVGMDENGLPLYFEVMVVDETSGENIYGGIFFYEDAELGYVAELLFGLYDAESNPLVNFYMGGNYLGDAADPNVYSAEFIFTAAEGETTLAEAYMSVNTAAVEGSAQPEYEMTMSQSMYDGESGMQMVNNSQIRQGLTANGGEFSNGTTQVDTYVEGTEMSASSSVEFLIEPTADGGFIGTYHISETLPVVKNMTLDMAIASEAYDPATSAALETLQIENMTNDEMTALIADIQNALVNDKLFKLLDILPDEVVNMLMESNEAA